MSNLKYNFFKIMITVKRLMRRLGNKKRDIEGNKFCKKYLKIRCATNEPKIYGSKRTLLFQKTVQ